MTEKAREKIKKKFHIRGDVLAKGPKCVPAHQEKGRLWPVRQRERKNVVLFISWKETAVVSEQRWRLLWSVANRRSFVST